MPHALMVFSHLRWDFVFQRPQHLLTRLAEKYKIYFFEEPMPGASSVSLEMYEPAPNVRVCRPHTTIAAQGFHDEQIPVLQQLLAQLLQEEEISDYAVWFYSPMALPLMNKLTPHSVIYDCMDELSAFRNAPKQLLQRESALLKLADVVFTGGPSLYRSKRDRHPAVHCFPSSVDAVHFGQARSAALDHPEQRSIAHPRLGFFGVIDERIDLNLIASVADARPDWQLIMVGPVAKIDAQSLPRQPNIHYFGQRSYAELPQFLAGWDVCLQPFAMNEATRFISPTKTLEYMAAERPIVSTPIADVVGPYGEIVYIADDAASFIAACERALNAPAQERARRTQDMRRTIESTSWDRTAAQMQKLIESTGARSPMAAAIFPDAERDTDSRSRKIGPPAARVAAQARATEYSAIVLGAGPTGLSAGYHLGEDSLVLERNPTVGGWCRSIEDQGFTFDFAGHIMFSNDPYVHQLYRKLLGDNVHWQNREAWIYSKQVYTRYPFQGALFGLPPDVLKECIVGAIESRFGRLKEPAAAKAAANSSSVCVGKAESITDCCADGVAESTAPLAMAWPSGASSSEPKNFEEFIYKVWGAGVAKHFAIPYNRKLWAVPLQEMETSWLGGRVPMPDLEEMIEGALRPVAKPQGPNSRFGYPLRGGFQALMNGFLPLMKGDLVTGVEVVRIDAVDHGVELADGRKFAYRRLVSTAPLPELLRMLGDAVPADVLAASRQLRHVSVRCVNLGIGRENISDKHWIYYPEDGVFHRVFLQGNASPHCNAPGGFALTCEITYSPQKPLPCEGEALIDRCIEDCIKVGLITAQDAIVARNQIDMPYAYVVYDHARKANVERIRDWLKTQDIVLAGRYSEWEYYNSDHAFIAGRKAADAVLAELCSEVSAEAL